MLLLLAILILGAETGRQDSSRDWLVLGTLLTLIGVFGMRLLASFLAREN